MDEQRQPNSGGEEPAAETNDAEVPEEATREPQDDEVEEASEESFPASDPPSFTRTTTD